MKRALNILLVASMLVMLLIPMGVSCADNAKVTITKVEAKSQTVHSGETFTVTVYGTVAGTVSSDRSDVVLVRKQQNSKESITRKTGQLTDKGNGVYEAIFDVTDEWISGDYSIESVDLSRETNGTNTYNDSDHIYVDYDNDNIIPKDVAYSIKTNNTDALPPEITKVEAKSGTYYLGDEITITAYISDTSGVDPERCQVSINIPNNIKSGVARFLEDKGNGKYETTFKVDNYYEAGDYVIGHVSAKDIYGNEIAYHNEKNHDGGDPNGVIPENVFTVIKEKNPNPSPTPSESPAPSETVAPTESPKPSETVSPTESPKPSEAVTPTESPKPSESTVPVSKKFSDVPVSGTWYSDAVYYAAKKGYMDGTGNNKFNPTGTVTRGTIAQILYAAEGKPAVSGSSKFTDVKAGKWYAHAVNWAASKGLVSGYGNAVFKPEAPVTREQMVAIMYKYSEMKGYDLTAAADLSKFADQSQVSKWAVNSMKWGVDHKIISGTNKGIEPKGNATRAQIAVILQAYDNNVRN